MNTIGSQRPVRSTGERPTVIILHAAAGAPEQWQPLVERLRFRYRVLVPDLHGYATSRARETSIPLSLDVKAALIEHRVDAFAGPVYLVGQDYGAAVALKLAHRCRERIGGLVLYEPTAFGLLHADPRSRYAALEIAILRHVLDLCIEAGDWFEAVRRYVDHYAGRDVWQDLGAPGRAALEWRMPELCAALDAQLADPTPLAEYARIEAPVWLLTTGARTRAATERIAERLAGTLPRAEWRRIEDADRKGPASRPEAVDREIERFLAPQQASGHRDPDPTAAFGRPVSRRRDRVVPDQIDEVRSELRACLDGIEYPAFVHATHRG